MNEAHLIHMEAAVQLLDKVSHVHQNMRVMMGPLLSCIQFLEKSL
jgi:hypothetical protein